jgi:hypothetical protein
MGDPEIKCNPLLSKEMVMESIAIRLLLSKEMDGIRRRC